MTMRKLAAAFLAAIMLLACIPAVAEDTEPAVEEEITVEVEESAEEEQTVAEEPIAAEEQTAEEPTGAEQTAEETAAQAVDLTAESQKLDVSYTLALNAINAEDYETAKEYLDICFVYCDPTANPEIYADLLLKRACINVIEEKNDMALLNLDAAIRVQPDLADAYLVRTQVYAGMGEIDRAVASLETYIDLTKDTSMYETVAQLQEAMGNMEAAQEAYAKYAEGAGADIEEVGFQNGLYTLEAGKYEDAIAAFEAYTDNEVYGAAAMYNIGICRMNMGDYAGAAEAFATCEEKGGTFEGLYYNRGICRLQSGDFAGAAADFTKSAETEPYVADARYNLGYCQMLTEDYEGAVATFTALIEAGEGAEGENAAAVNPGAWYYRAVCRDAMGDAEGAIADYTYCIENDIEVAQCYYLRAQLYGAAGDEEKQNADLASYLKYAE